MKPIKVLVVCAANREVPRKMDWIRMGTMGNQNASLFQTPKCVAINCDPGYDVSRS